MAKHATFDYAAKTAELEAVLAGLQDSATPLDEAMKLHADGLKLVAEIEAFLKLAENEVQKHLAKAE